MEMVNFDKLCAQVMSDDSSDDLRERWWTDIYLAAKAILLLFACSFDTSQPVDGISGAMPDEDKGSKSCVWLNFFEQCDSAVPPNPYIRVSAYRIGQSILRYD
jgi:hypothetical protein